MQYLQNFYKKMEKWKGSLIRVEMLKEQNAKEYLNRLARAGLIERISWGWYWIPVKIKDELDFLSRDKNFKIIASQTAASFWNADFVHRDIYIVKVTDRSFAKALEEFSKQKNLKIRVKYVKDKIDYVRIGKLKIGKIEDSIIDCIQNWAFIDAFATLYANKKRIDFENLARENYWKRIPKSSVRVGQVLGYGCYRLNKLAQKRLFSVRKVSLEDKFIKREVDEAVEKVAEYG